MDTLQILLVEKGYVNFVEKMNLSSFSFWRYKTFLNRAYILAFDKAVNENVCCYLYKWVDCHLLLPGQCLTHYDTPMFQLVT